MAEYEEEVALLIRSFREQNGRLLTVGAVESATGGRISDRLTSIPGSSDYYRGSIIAYNNHLKITLVGVQVATIEEYGAVSEQTALEMAQGGRTLLGVDICISDTGIAGPGGATAQKPVGLFCFALAAEGACLTQTRVFSGDRHENKQAATETVLHMLARYLSTCVHDC